MLLFQPAADGQTACGRVPIRDDSLGNEPDELFSVTITNVSDHEIVIGSNRESCVKIVDNDGKRYFISWLMKTRTAIISWDCLISYSSTRNQMGGEYSQCS